MSDVRIAIVVCSDSCSAGQAEDTAGPALAEECQDLGWIVVERVVVPDEHEHIVERLEYFSDEDGVDIVFTCGGTGFGPRDVTPEATQVVCDRMASGIAEAMRAGSMAVTRRAMLSRAAAGVRGCTLIVNLPGSRKAAVECFGFVADQLEHARDMMAGEGH